MAYQCFSSFGMYLFRILVYIQISRKHCRYGTIIENIGLAHICSCMVLMYSYDCVEHGRKKNRKEFETKECSRLKC